VGEHPHRQRIVIAEEAVDPLADQKVVVEAVLRRT
jgi:hypothetical protein